MGTFDVARCPSHEHCADWGRLMRPDHRSRLLRVSPVVIAIVLLLVAAVGVAAKGPPPGKGPGTKTTTTDYIANCDTSGWSSPSMTSWEGVIAVGSTVKVSGKVQGDAWAGNCPTAQSGTEWLAVTTVNGVSASTLYGQSPVYFASGFFRLASDGGGGGSTGNLEGIDVSKWQGAIDYNQVRNSGRSFVIARASYGGLVDEWYTTNKANARAAGLAFGAYHFAYPNLNPSYTATIEEADTFVAAMGIQRGMLIPALDLETCNSGLGTAGMIQWVKNWLERVYSRTGARAMIYASPNFWATCMGDTRWFADNGYPILWVAHWTSSSAPSVPAQNWGGRSWTFWQYTSQGSVPGVSGNVDLDRFNGTSLSSVTY